ncbi:MAG: DUF1611 domain-containing protein [Gemmatimonadaceae bacterium]
MARDLRYLVLAEGQFGPMTSKTANGCIRYSPERVVAVLDSRHAGRTANEVIGYGGEIPVVGSVQDGLSHAPNALLIGIAPTGGKFPESWRDIVRAAIRAGLEIWSGLHTFLGDDPEFAALARERDVPIHDLRKPPENLTVAAGRARDVESTIVLTVGTDCNIGKMTASLQLRDGLRARRKSVAFAGTGQTGILIEGWGISVDAVIADFIAGAAERLTLDAAKEAEIVLVEGQGSLVHPSYSGVTYGLMHGSLPHAMIMCTQPSRVAINNNPWVKIPPLADFIALHERVLAPLRRSKTIAVAMNTYDLSEAAARDAIRRTEDETGLPATDPVRFDSAPIVDAIEKFHATRRG